MKKKYWILLLVVFLVWLDWYIRAPDGRSRELTRIIQTQGSVELREYPYTFHVTRVEGETAYLSTPRNVEVPAFKALGALYPNINTKDPNNPAFIAEEQHLARVQSEARALIMAQPGIKDVQWALDREWLASHGIEIQTR